MKHETWPGYSAAGPAEAVALRSGPPAAVRAALVAARERTLALAQHYEAALGAGQTVPYAPELNPPRWEWGHVAWFQEWWVGRNPQRERGIACDPDAARPPSAFGLADAWYDSSRVAHRTRWDLPLPDAASIRSSLADSLEQTLAILDRLPPDAGDDGLYFFRLVALHELMHAEAAAYMARTLGMALPVALPALPPPRPPLVLPAQRFVLGSPRAGFAFDNELGAHEVAVAAIEIDAQPVSGAQFTDFIRAGGYERRAYWSDAGWAWRLEHADPAREFAPDRPADHLSAHEADAWCRWAGRQLPTEAQWECAALTLPGFTWGGVWEWTASEFAPYPGFVAHPYRDYSQPWFGSRRVLRGASTATSPALAHARYRNFFEPHRRDVITGFRSGRALHGASVDAV